MSSIFLVFGGSSKLDLEPKISLFFLVGGDGNTIAAGVVSLLLFNGVVAVVVVVQVDAAANSN